MENFQLAPAERLNQPGWLRTGRTCLPGGGKRIQQFLSVKFMTGSSRSQIGGQQFSGRFANVEKDPDISFWLGQGKAALR